MTRFPRGDLVSLPIGIRNCGRGQGAIISEHRRLVSGFLLRVFFSCKEKLYLPPSMRAGKKLPIWMDGWMVCALEKPRKPHGRSGGISADTWLGLISVLARTRLRVN